MPDVKATYLRKHLFQILERAVHGEAVEITYKGATLKLMSQANGSKLAKAVRRKAVLVDPQSIVESDTELMAGMEATWRKDDETL